MCGQSDGRTDRQKMIVPFYSFVNGLNKVGTVLLVMFHLNSNSQNVYVRSMRVLVMCH